LDTTDVLLAVLLIAASVACGFVIWALREMVETARSVRALSDETRASLIPVIDKADVTIDAANAELLRIDAIITQVEDATARMSHASGTISEIVSTPAELVNDVAGRVRRAWKDRRRTASSHEPHPEREAEDIEPDSDENGGVVSSESESEFVVRFETTIEDESAAPDPMDQTHAEAPHEPVS